MEDNLSGKGPASDFSDSKGGASLLTTPVKGIVKNNIDSTRSGRIQVFINKYKGNNPDDTNSWLKVDYLSPFFGYTPNTGSPDSNGTYSGNPNSYGFWATPPDIGTEVLCVFENGDPNFGYYIGSIVKPGLNHMVPAIGSTDKIIANESEADAYGGATRLPAAEFNNANESQSGSPDLSNQPRPIHSYQAAILNKQGLLRDPDRGTIGSSSVRETPSRVFGISTPGRPIYGGGYDDISIKEAVKDTSVPDSNFKVTGRLGGHTLVMDDGDLQGRDQLLRLRTAAGHMIMMNDSVGAVYIVHSSGQSYIELGKEGTIDMYSTNSVNIRTQGDLNLHADNNMNIHVAKDLSIRAENIKLESTKETSQLVGTNLKQHVKGNHTDKVDGMLSLASAGDGSLNAGGNAFINGKNVNLNTGATSLTPEVVSPLVLNKMSDTLYDEKKGYASAPGKLESIASRAPAHSPWEEAGKGVDVKVNMSASANLPSAPSPSVSAANAAAPASPDASTSPALTATVPSVASASPALDKATTGAMVSQMAVNAATGPAADAVKSAAGVATVDGVKTASLGAMAMSPQQLETAGYIKPGAGAAIDAAIQGGKKLEEAIPPNMMTGKDGVNTVSDFVKSVSTQTKAASDLLGKASDGLKSAGIITGKESPTQTGGLIMAAASAGVGAVAGFIKSAMPSTAGITSIASGLGLNASKIPNPLGGDIGKQIASGNFASGLADKALSGLGGLGDSLKSGLNSAKGAAAAAFDSVVSKFKSFKAGVPISLSAEKAKVDAESSGSMLDSIKSGASGLMNKASSMASGAGLKLPTSLTSLTSGQGLNLTSVLNAAKSLGVPSNITGSIALGGSLVSGASSLLSKVSGSNPLSSMSTELSGGKLAVPGLSEIGDKVKGLASNITGGSASDIMGKAKSLLGGGATPDGLMKMATAALGGALPPALKGALGSLGTGGGMGIKLPTISIGGFDSGAIAAQSKALLGDPKIPALKFGDAPPLLDSSEMLRISRARTAASDKALAAQEVYEKSLAKTGSRIDPATSAAFAEWKQAIADIDKVA